MSKRQKVVCVSLLVVILLVMAVPGRSFAEDIVVEPSAEETVQSGEVIVLDGERQTGASADGVSGLISALEGKAEGDAEIEVVSSEPGDNQEAEGKREVEGLTVASEDDVLVQRDAQSVAPDTMGEFFSEFDNGLVWHCKEYRGGGSSSEAVIYGVTSNRLDVTTDLNVPKTVKNASKPYTVVGIISQEEAYDEDGDFEMDWYFEDHFIAPGSVENDSWVYENNQIETIIIPDSVRFIGAGAFAHYTKLGAIYLNGNVKLESIGAQAFVGCTGLEDISYSSSLSDVVIPSSVTYIGDEAFLGCTTIKRIVFPLFAEIDGNPLGGNDSLKTIENAPGTCSLSRNVERIAYRSGITRVQNWGDPSERLTELVIPDGVEEVKGFSGFTALKTVHLPEGIRELGSFDGCVSLESINLPASLEDAGSYYGCKNLHIAITQPEEDWLLDQQYAQSGITSVTLPASLRYMISYISFSGCKDLQSINVIPGGKFCSSDGVFYYRDTDTSDMYGYCLFKYPAAKAGSSYTVPDWVKVVYALAFEDCNLSEIHIPATVYNLDALYNSEILNQNSDWDGTKDVYGPFDRMASNPTIYYVKNSYADDDIHSAWKHLSGNFVPEPGPPVAVTYVLNGGMNASGNPTTIIGGSSATLKNPSRSGYTFDGWYNKSTGEKCEGGVLTPRLAELYEGVTVEARWSAGVPDLSHDGWVNFPNGDKGYVKNGSLVKGWFDLGQSKYWFNYLGRMAKGWTDIEVSGNQMHYYFNPASGNLVRNTWFTIDGDKYYFRPSGNMATGWATISDGGVDKKYYFNEWGTMLTGWQDIDTGQGYAGHYYFRPSGAMATGWATIDGEKYWFRPSGNMATGFADVDDAYKRYFDVQGHMVTGWQRIGSSVYYFRPSGAMQTGSATIDGASYTFTVRGVLVGEPPAPKKPDYASDMALGRTSASAGDGESWYGWFVASEAGTYAFYSEGDVDTYGTLFAADGKTQLASNDDWDDRNFRIERELAKGEAVVLQVRDYYGGSFECDVVAERLG